MWRKMKKDFLVNELVTICNVFWIGNAGSFGELASRIIFGLCDSDGLKTNIVHDDSSDTEPEILSEFVMLTVVVWVKRLI